MVGGKNYIMEPLVRGSSFCTATLILIPYIYIRQVATLDLSVPTHGSSAETINSQRRDNNLFS